MFFALIVCFATSLLPCCASWCKQNQNTKNPPSSFFWSYSLFIPILVRNIHTIVPWKYQGRATVQQLFALTRQTGLGLQQLQRLLVLSTYALSGVNLTLAYIIRKTKHPIGYSLLFVIVLISVLSISATMFTGTSPFVNFFVACCGVMAYFAFVLELTYKEFCVLGNIYLQATICLIAATAPLLKCLRKQSYDRLFIMLAVSVINLSIHGIFFFVICKHYWMPLDPAFDLCYSELVHLASATGSTYIIVNLVIFVILFVGDLILNSVLYKLVK